MPLKSASKKAAYLVVDISKHSRQAQDEIKADALMGGPNYGLIIVELAIAGANQTPLFGYYLGTDGEKKWKEAQSELADDSDEEHDPPAPKGKAKPDPDEEGEHETEHVGLLGDEDLPPVDHSARRKPTK